MNDRATNLNPPSTGGEREYDVEVVRTSYSRLTIRVKASNEQEAKDRAVDEAGGHEFPGAYSDAS